MISKNKLILVKEQEFDYDIEVKNNIDVINFLENIIKLQEEPEEVFICITLDTKKQYKWVFWNSKRWNKLLQYVNSKFIQKSFNK